MKAQTSVCPCGSGAAYAYCCGPYHAGAAAPDAEQLMRSRYSAYVLGREDYLLATWHPDTRPQALNLDAPPCPQWRGLTVRAHNVQDADHATVAFEARYKLNGRAYAFAETSRFVRRSGRWCYLDGDTA